MSNAPFVVRVLPSRKLQQTVAIPWAEPAPLTGQGYPAWLSPKTHKTDLQFTKPTLPTLDEYPVVAANDGELAARTLEKATKTAIDVNISRMV